MKKEFELLKEWTLNYIKNRDILAKEIKSIEENSDEWDIVVKAKEEKRYYMIKPAIEDFKEILDKLDSDAVTVVVLNTKENLNMLIENWASLIDCPKMCMIFVNPHSELEKKWVVFPHAHEKVAESASLKRGLKTLFQTVEPWKK